MTDSRRHTILVEMFSTIRSPVFSELAFDVRHYELARLSVDLAFFETLRQLNGIRSFNLVFMLCGVGPSPSPNNMLREFEKVLGSVTERALLDFLGSPPTVKDVRRIVRPPNNYRWDVTFPESDN